MSTGENECNGQIFSTVWQYELHYNFANLISKFVFRITQFRYRKVYKIALKYSIEWAVRNTQNVLFILIQKSCNKNEDEKRTKTHIHCKRKFTGMVGEISTW